MTVSRSVAAIVTLMLCVCGASKVQAGAATIFDFEITVDGTTPSVDPGSTDPVGVTMFPGDSFLLDLHASPDSYWRVNAEFSQSFPLSFIVNPSGERLANVVSSFQRNGVEVANIAKSGIIQSQVHIGAENWTLPTGLEFDTVLMNYDLLDAVELGGGNTVDTIIQDRPFLFGNIGSSERPFFRHPNIAFITIPEPTALAMLTAGLLSFATVRRRSVRS